MNEMYKSALFSLEEKSETERGRFRINARSANPVECDNLFFIDHIIHDNCSVRHEKKVAIDYAHGEDLIGYADEFAVENGDLIVYGRLTPVVENDTASQIIAKSKMGVPYEASIFWDEDTETERKMYDSGEVKANGKTYAASKDKPITLIKNWILRRVAICGSGRDRHTESHIYKEKAMEEKPAVETPNAPVEPVVAPQPEHKTPSISETIADYKKEFGAMGVEYLEKGLSKEDARVHHTQYLQKRVEELEKALSVKASAVENDDVFPVVVDGKVAGSESGNEKRTKVSAAKAFVAAYTKH
jgi:hypothetical protein